MVDTQEPINKIAKKSKKKYACLHYKVQLSDIICAMVQNNLGECWVVLQHSAQALAHSVVQVHVIHRKCENRSICWHEKIK